MQVSEIMTSQVDLIDPNSTICDAALKMKDDDVGAIPVGENDRLVGMITDRDITIRAVAAHKNCDETTVREVMSQGVTYCFDDDTLDKAAKAMGQHQVKRLPVLNHDKRLVGIVSLSDFARCGTEGEEAEKFAMKGIAEESGSERRV